MPIHAFPSCAGLGAGVTAPPPGQHFSAWTLWDEAEFDSLAGPRTPAASGSGHGPGAGSYSSPRNHTVGASTEETTESQMPPPGQHFSPWSLWNEAEEQAWDQRPRAAQRVDEVDEVDEEANAPPWNVRRYAAGTASTGSGHSPDAIDPAGLPSSISFNPALPAGWPAGHSFAHHCHVLNTLEKSRGSRVARLGQAALSASHAPPIYIHLLEDEVPGFPSPQFTAFAGASPLQAFAVPLDLRPAGWGVCVAPVRNRASLSTIVSHARTVCPVSNFQQKVARRTLTATSKGRALHPFTPLPVDTDHVRFQRASRLDAENSATTDSISDVIAQAAIDRELDEAILEHLDEDGYFSVAIHAPDCPSLSTTVHRLESPHALARRASQMLLPIRPHVTVQACWPIEHPRDPEHVLHLLLSFDQPQCPDSTMFLIDCRGIMGRTQDFVAFAARRELTAGELLALIHEHANGISPPAFVLVNNKPLSDLGMRRYSLPLVRLLTRQQYVAWQRHPERHCPATWPTSLLLRHLPCFQALSETFEAFLQRRFGYFRGRDQAASEPALHSPSNPAHGLQENSTSEEELTAAGTTTTTTTVGEVCWRNDTQGLTTSTTTSGELPGNAHPFGTLQTGVLQVHLFSHCDDILTSTVRTEDLAEVLLFKMCRSLLQHQCLAAGEDLVTCPRVHFSEQGPHLFLHTCRPESSARCWIFAPQWLDCPLAIRCGTGWSRAAFFRAIGLQDLPGATVTVAGRV